MNIAQKVLSTYAFDKQSIEKMVDDDDKTSSNFWVLHWPLLEWSGTVVSFAVACGKRLCDKNKVFKREQRFSSFSAAFATFAFVG